MFVKVCGLTHEEDVAAAIEAGADALGFVFAESVRRVSPERAARLAEAIPSGVCRIAVMLHPAPGEWLAVAAALRPDVLQADAGDFVRLAVDETIRRWPVYRQKRGQQTGQPFAAAATEFVYEGARSGQGETVDWRVAADIARDRRMILAGGLGPDNVADAVRAVRPWGVDASSGLECAPGRKDPLKMAAYVAAARSALG